VAPPLEFGGEETFRAEPARLFKTLTEPEQLARTIPDLVTSECVDQRTLRATVRPGFSFLRGTLKLVITVEEAQSPESATMRVAAQGIGLSMRILSRLTIAPEGAGSRLTWRAEVEELKGLAAALSPGLIQGAADHVIRHAWKQVRTQLGED
jgi:carbon monoxide dehydrogenase subunit G